MRYEESGVGVDRRQYYSASRGPFQDAPNLLTFYGGAGRGAVLDEIVARRRDTNATVHVYGERGSGLTYLSLVLGDRLKRACNVIRHERRVPSRAMLLRHLLIELCPAEADLIGAAADDVDATTLSLATRRIMAQLMRVPPGGKPYLLTVDWTEAPDAASLALLDELAGVRRADHPAMHVVLFRRVETALAHKSGGYDHDGRSLDGIHWLRRLTLNEVGEYLRHRMMLFDFSRRDMFSREMSYFVTDRTEGVIGAIDALVRQAFALASLEDNDRPSMAHLLAAGFPARSVETPEAPFLVRHRRAFVALLGIGVVASGAALVLLLG